jgi:tetratricopeptide (TPR) repeat protein
MELEEKLYHTVVKLCEDGDNLLDDEKYHDAIKKYQTALDLIPSPKTDWEASTWIYTAIGDAYFLAEDYPMAKEHFYNALNCPDGISNPLILLRLGESLLECNEVEKAKDFLLRAYMVEGEKIFEEEDKKYFNLIKPII